MWDKMNVQTVLFVFSLFLCVGIRFAPSAVSAQECPLLFAPSALSPSQTYNYSSPSFESLFAALNSSIERYIARHRIPSYAIAIVHQNRTLFNSGLTGTPFRIASITKTITALGALMLREQGLLLLDDPVKKFLPDFSIINPFGQHDTTLRELMGHAAGFPRDLCPMLMTCTSDETTILTQIAGMQLISPPWTDNPAYSNLGISLLGHAWEKATVPALSWEEFVMENIVKPLGMTNTGINLNDIDLAVNNNLYARQDLGWSAPAAQMYSTADDLAKYLVFLLNAEPSLLSDTSIREWISPATLFSDEVAGFAFPWELLKLYDNSTEFLITKSGDINGYRSYIAFDPPTQLGIVVLSVIEQGISSGAPDELGNNLLRITIPIVQSVNQEMIAAQYAGVYTCKRSGKFESPTLNYTTQVSGGTINVSVDPTVGLLAYVDLSLKNAGQPITSSGTTWAFLLKNATEKSFWFGDGTSCSSIVGAVSSAPDLYHPNAPQSMYTNVVVFDPEEGSLEWPAVGAHCYKTGFAPSKGTPRSRTSLLVGIIVSFCLLVFVF